MEQSDYLLEEVHSLITGLIVGIARRVNGIDAGAVSSPLMLPESLVGLIVALPVGLHVGQQIGFTGVLKQSRDVRVVTRRVTVGTVGTIAIVGPIVQA